MNIRPLTIETPTNFDKIFTFSKPLESNQSLNELDKIQNVIELESHIHNLKGHNDHNMMEIKKLKEQNKLLKEINLQEELKNKKLKDQYMEALEEIKSLQEQEKHNDFGIIKIKELNKSLQDQNNHNIIGIDKLKEIIKNQQEKLSSYENDIKTLSEQNNHNMIGIDKLKEINKNIQDKLSLSEQQGVKVEANDINLKKISENNINFIKQNKKAPTSCW
jgi:hypothetical protein